MIEVGDYYYDWVENMFHPVNSEGRYIDVIGRVVKVDDGIVEIKVTNSRAIRCVGAHLKLSKVDEKKFYKDEDSFKKEMIKRTLRK